MDSQITNTVEIVVASICSLLSTIFTLLALFVLVYYIRRRYKLYKEINRIPQELLVKESYRNHLKNLKVKCIINNFIIVIVIMEIILNLGMVFMVVLYVINFYVKETEFNFRTLTEFQKYLLCFTHP